MQLRTKLILASISSLLLAVGFFLTAGMLIGRYYENASGAISACFMLSLVSIAVCVITAIAAFIVRR